MNKVTTKELREFIMKYLREEKKGSERSCNYYNSVIRFIYNVVLSVISYTKYPLTFAYLVANQPYLILS